MTGRWRVSWVDALLALAVAVAGVVESYGRAGDEPGQVHHPAALAAGAALAGGVLLVRRRFPRSALLVLTAIGVFFQLVVRDDYVYAAWQFYSTLILVHTVGHAAVVASRRGLTGLLCVLVTYGWLQTLPGQDLAESLISGIFIGVAYASGILLRRQTDQTVWLTERATRLEMEREEREHRAVAEERIRIARELHDVISHNVSLMTLQTGGVRMLLGTADHVRERDLLRGVERAGRETVAELRLMLGVLRGGDDAPTPGLDRLPELVEQVRATGLTVHLRVEGDRRALPPGLDLSAYRVVQEALTNVLRHARAERADVTVSFGAEELRLTITDNGRGGGGSPGHGLIGMRERAAIHGGSLTAGPLAGGDYRVVARFPLSDG